MNFLQFLPERWHGLAREVAKFGTIGVINLCVNVVISNLLWLTILSQGEVKAKAIATIIATTSAYFLNRHWTYRDRPKSTLRREYTLFFLFNLVGLLIEVGVVSFAKYGLHQRGIIMLNLVTGIGIVFGTIFRFWAYRTHVFKLAPADLGATPAQAPITVTNAVNGHLASAHAIAAHEALTHTAAEALAHGAEAWVHGADALTSPVATSAAQAG